MQPFDLQNSESRAKALELFHEAFISTDDKNTRIEIGIALANGHIIRADFDKARDILTEIQDQAGTPASLTYRIEWKSGVNELKTRRPEHALIRLRSALSLAQSLQPSPRQDIAQIWNDLLWSSGGMLKLPKCSYHLIATTHTVKGHPALCGNHDAPPAHY